MDIKERVLASAKTSYAKYGFKKSELGELAAIIAKNLTDESTDEDIQAALTANEGFAQMMQSVYNRGVSETTDKFKGYVPAPKKAEDPAPATPMPDSLTAESVREMIAASLKQRQKEIDDAVNKAVAPLLEREKSARLRNLLQGNEKLKAIPEVFREKYVLDKEEDLDSMVSKIETDWASTKQALVASGQFVEAPQRGNPQSEADDFIKTLEGFSERNQPAKTNQSVTL